MRDSKLSPPLLPSLLDIRNYWSLVLLPICQTHSWVDSDRFVNLTPVVGCQRRHDKSTTRHGRRLVVPLSLMRELPQSTKCVYALAP